MRAINTACTIMLLPIIAFASPSATKNAMNITLLNISNQPAQAWISGIKHTIPLNSALSSPCQPGEEIEIQIQEKLEYLQCGQTLDIKQ